VKTGRPRPDRNRRPVTSREYQERLRRDAEARHQHYTPPSVSQLPPKPPWLKLGITVAILRPVSDRCAFARLGTVYEIRPTADGETWEVAVQLRGSIVGDGRRFRLHNPQEFVEWMPEAPPKITP
jgi:hypothetical protein